MDNDDQDEDDMDDDDEDDDDQDNEDQDDDSEPTEMQFEYGEQCESKSQGYCDGFCDCYWSWPILDNGEPFIGLPQCRCKYDD